ncbi:MAG: SNF2-related protein [Planctomycetota bacterium]|nr:SNF2-related protein [Planctomycetota bacterium]
MGETITHTELGEGVLVRIEASGYARVYFREHGERQVPVTTLARGATWEEQVVAALKPATPEAVRRLWLAVEAERLPLMDSAATLTAAKVDLLPHQIVLTYRVANASPRRFLIADSVGLGKTIETALILRELASRGELGRAMMVVPAGLVENWRRELNEKFSLDFEVFGSQGDVTDRKSNAFAKHNRLIVSIDTLKRPARVKKLLEAPPWDLIVFDEAHHLTAYESGKKVQKTQNFKLAEALREHSRDLMLLSATPHQGDHFRFWMLVRLLDPRLYEGPGDMVDNRHRLNAVVFRRTQADACNADGEPLFARRQVHTSAFHLNEAEAKFYEALMGYLRDGYNLAAQAGPKGQSLGFVMTIFQKIASSSFAAVAATLRRRLLMLTIHEAVVCDENLDTDGRDRAYAEARELIRSMHAFGHDPVGRAEVDRLMADAKLKLLRKLDARMIAERQDSEVVDAGDEESVAALVAVALPEERKRIRALLAELPAGAESKTEELLRGLGDLWRSNPQEKVVIFTTFLGSVDTIQRAIEERYPGKGADVLKGGDHGAKTAAEKRFRRVDGPRVLICTAAGREGINLQFARVLFNHDLPWNPMDMEQRIGRIHRYGQRDTAQVYNIVSADTIEGQIFLMLEQKLLAIAEALGKVDEYGQVTEDLRGQVLGQLAERISYDQLYQDAVRDPTLKRTKQELEVAMENAKVARNVVFELFQDLEGFNLEEYRRFDDGGQGMRRLLAFVQEATAAAGGSLKGLNGAVHEATLADGQVFRFTTDRARAKEQDDLSLLGLEHPLVRKFLGEFQGLDANARAVQGRLAGGSGGGAGVVLTVWRAEIHGPGGRYKRVVLPMATSSKGERLPQAESLINKLQDVDLVEGTAVEATQGGKQADRQAERRAWVTSALPEMVRRELQHRGLLDEGASVAMRLLGYVELV